MPLPPPPSKRADRLSSTVLPPKAAVRTAASADKNFSKIETVSPPPASQKAKQPRAVSPSHATIVTKPTAKRAPPPPPTLAPAQAGKSPGNDKHRAIKEKLRLFVLDTNVLLHDPMSLFRFKEHDIYLPMIVLEELDAHKKGLTEVARNGRQASRELDALASKSKDISHGMPLSGTGHTEATGKLFFQTSLLQNNLPHSLPQGKADNQILGVVAALQHQYDQNPDTAEVPDVVLVSKDINMRIKARALGLKAEDYENDKTLQDGDLLYAGSMALPPDFWMRNGKKIESWQSGENTFYRISGPIVPSLNINQFLYFEAAGEPSLYARVTGLQEKTAVLQTLKDYTSSRKSVWGVCARNREQNFALNLLMNPELDLVTLTGMAGTGKTLLALAAGLTQVLDERRYSEIIMTRATVSVGEDIGFLPGTEEEKMGPWMGALDDNLEFLSSSAGTTAGEWGRSSATDLIRSRIKIKSMNFMRGRTFLNKFVIIDEAQNLTPKQMKTLITRAGPGTKMVCMGNIAQIDTPYLTEGSSGLTYAVDRFKNWPYAGHITLARGERSRLADFASDVL